MKSLLATCLFLIATALQPSRARAADAEGCADLKLFPRLEGCTIVECSAKQHDSFESADATAGTLDVNTNSVTYSCPASIDIERVSRELDAAMRKSGYLSGNQDKSDPSNPVVTARKGSHWLRWGASSDDGETSYWLTEADPASERFKPEACTQPRSIPALQHCELLECESKSEDSVTMHSAADGETTLTGGTENALLRCSSNPPQQFLSAAADQLKSTGFEILFSDHDHTDGGFITARAGKRWMEIATVPDGDSVSYATTVVPDAEVLTAAKAEAPAAAPDGSDKTPSGETAIEVAPTPAAPQRVKAIEAEVATPDPQPLPPESATAPVPSSISTATLVPQTFSGGFVPPKPTLEVAIEPTHERIYSVMGEVVIHVLVDVDETGSVTHAELTGRITKDVSKLQSAALEAASRWRFEPARQDGRVVAAVKIPIEMHFRGRPWRF